MRAQVLIFAFKFTSLITLCANSATFRLDKTHHGHRVRTIASGELSKNLSLLQELNHLALKISESKTQLHLEQSVEVYFNSIPTDHNGLATAIPRNRIYIHTEAPPLNSSIGISTHYLLETLVHEWAHHLSFQKHSGVFKPLDWIFGNTARPNGSWPRWIHEGIAVWAEGSVGGRPQSGSIDFDLRRYQIAASQSSEAPLQNSDLDGQWPINHHEKIRDGQIPYTFGYLIWNEITQNHGTKILKEFVNNSSANLGISFRKVFNDLDVSLDKTFDQLQKKWTQIPAKIHSTSLGQLVSKASEIRGLNVYGNTASWIEEKNSLFTHLVDATNPKNLRKVNWPFELFEPLQAHYLQNQNWAVLINAKKAWVDSGFYSDKVPTQRLFVLWNEESKSLTCRFDLNSRLREVQIFSNKIIWIESSENGEYSIHNGILNFNNCSISQAEKLYNSDAFHRISAAQLNKNNPASFQINYPNHNLKITEKILDSSGQILLHETNLENTTYTNYQTGDSNNYALVFERSPHYWGPLLLEKTSSHKYKSKKFPLKTGAWEAAILSTSSSTSGVFVVENFWDHDLVRYYDFKEIEKLESNHQTFEWKDFTSINHPITKKQSHDSLSETQTPIDSIWPHFWIPSIMASEGGWLIAGQTFYSDISETWSGSSLIGFESLTHRPFGLSTLSWTPNFKDSASHTKATFSTLMEYRPRDISYFGIPDQNIQERWLWETSVTLKYSLLQKLTGAIRTGYTLHYSGKLADFNESYSHIPLLYFNLRTPYGFSPSQSLSLLTDSPGFIFFEQQTRWLEGIEAKAEFSALAKTTSKTRWLLQTEWAHTSQSNFPKSYFTWGGMAPMSAIYSDYFLNRGFAPFSYATQQLFRLNTEWLIRIWDPEWSFSWNRFRLQSMDMRIIAETISWTPFFDNRHKLGHQFATSIGSEIDLMGSSLHYLKYRFSTGAFKGFGPEGEIRITASLRMGLDL